jgi:hypothetical protein
VQVTNRQFAVDEMRISVVSVLIEPPPLPRSGTIRRNADPLIR